MQYWLLKTEPNTFSWTDLCRLGRDLWDGVRNYQARNYLREMQLGDQALFYHSGKERAIQGIVEVVRTYYPDPTAKGEHSWVVVDVVPRVSFDRALSLAQLRKEALLSDMVLLNHARLSVQPVREAEFKQIVDLAEAHI